MHRVKLAALAALVVTGSAHAQSNCAADTSGDGQVNGVDFALVLTSLRVCQENPAISGAAQSGGDGSTSAARSASMPSGRTSMRHMRLHGWPPMSFDSRAAPSPMGDSRRHIYRPRC